MALVDVIRGLMQDPHIKLETAQARLTQELEDLIAGRERAEEYLAEGGSVAYARAHGTLDWRVGSAIHAIKYALKLMEEALPEIEEA